MEAAEDVAELQRGQEVLLLFRSDLQATRGAAGEDGGGSLVDDGIHLLLQGHELVLHPLPAVRGRHEGREVGHVAAEPRVDTPQRNRRGGVGMVSVCG